jgi:ribosomal protein L18E
MFKKIKEFVKAFKNAYNTINVNKINAKKAIDDYSKKVDHIVYVSDSLKIIFERLEAIYSYLPKKERQDFILKTVDLIRYGRKDANGNFKDYCGFRSLYNSSANCAKNNLSNLKKLYKEGKYDEVVEWAKEYSERLEEFRILYNIIDIPNESKVD